jgi:hypothetical protein
VSDVPVPASPSRAIFAENAAGWLGSASRRRSRRAFDPAPAEPAKLARLGALCDAWRPYPDARVALVAQPAVDVFTGVLGSYGKVTGTPHLLVFIGNERGDFTDQHVGYTGQAVVLEAAAVGLATCWVAGFFSPKKVVSVVDLAPGERVFAVSPLGYPRARDALSGRAMAALARAHHRKHVVEIAPGVEHGEWPAWAVAAVETARVAPSALNRQPWRFRFDDGGLVVAKDSAFETPKVTKRLDIGIAMLHAELAAEAHGVSGHWTDLAGSDVARFDPYAGTFWHTARKGSARCSSSSQEETGSSAGS